MSLRYISDALAGDSRRLKVPARARRPGTGRKDLVLFFNPSGENLPRLGSGVSPGFSEEKYHVFDDQH